MNTDIVQILAKSHYQTFDLIEGDKRDSNSILKYELSHLDSYDLAGKSILDVGCNAGYFLFKLRNKGASKLIGIEIGEKFITIANDLNREVFKSPSIKFILGDFLTYQFNDKFDLIICFSTFHYFGYNQPIFFDHCYWLLNEGGKLLLEVEELPFNDEPRIDIDSRDPNRIYPNALKMTQYMKGRFNILNKYPSVHQKGSVYERWFYGLEKV